MSDVRPDDQQADRGTVWVVFGVYSDMSGSRILGIYTKQHEAEDRVKIAKEAGAAYSVTYAKVPLNRAFTVDLRP